MTTAEIPGYRVVDAPRPAPDPGLRNDVAAFLGSAERGPLGTAVRVDGRQSYAATFGGPGTGTVPRAVAAYFSNGGQVAWIVRAGRGGASSRASAILRWPTSAGWADDGAARLDLPGNVLTVTAVSPGEWANGGRVSVTYRAYGVSGAAELDVAVDLPGAMPIRRAAIGVAEMLATLNGTGLLVGQFSGPPAAGSTLGHGPAQATWVLTLADGAEPALGVPELRAAIVEQAQLDEIALVCVPGLAVTLGIADYDDVLAELAASAAASQDRLAVVSVPAHDAGGVTDWYTRALAIAPDPATRRTVAAYFPWLLAEDLTGRGPDPYRDTDPVGHICGQIARLDRERGSGWSPANTLVSDAIDVATPIPAAIQSAAIRLGINLLRPRIGGGLEIWGARTLDDGDGRYIAHRRLVHRIVRATRRAVEPLVFDINDRVLWFSVARAASGVLMEAFRSGALKGDTPDQAYRVRCDETTNPPAAIDDGQVVCEIDVAPAVPMEFITLRLTIGAEGLLEVVEQ